MKELQGSKAKLIQDLSKQIDLNYQQKIQGLQQRITDTIRTSQENIRAVEQHSLAASKCLDRAKRLNQLLTFLILGLLLFLRIFWSKHV